MQEDKADGSRSQKEEIDISLEERREDLLRDIAEYNRERDRIRAMLGKIGGSSYSKKDMVVNIIFLAAILILFVLELTTHFMPVFISLEVSVLLVSIKIVWMIHSQHKFNHFQFWVLNSLEFRINGISKDLATLMREMERGESHDTP